MSNYDIGGYEAARPFYDQARQSTKQIIIINLCRRSGEVCIDKYRQSGFKVHQDTHNKCFWFPMTEADCKQQSNQYLDEYFEVIFMHLQHGFACMVHCNEGVKRSVEFAAQLVFSQRHELSQVSALCS